MTAKHKQILSNILKASRDLTEAEESLVHMEEYEDSRAIRWGIWDGYTSRPSTYAGLVIEKNPQVNAAAIKGDYQHGYDIGVKIKAWESKKTVKA